MCDLKNQVDNLVPHIGCWNLHEMSCPETVLSLLASWSQLQLCGDEVRQKAGDSTGSNWAFF